MTRGQLLDLGVQLLGAKDTSVLDAEVLLCYVLGETKEYLFAHANDEVSDENLEKLYVQYLDRVGKGEPIAYITGEKEFYGFDFLVNKHVLVPRPETEMLVAQVLAFMKDNFEKHGKYKILDVGTGSGNIAISIAKTSENLGEDMIEYVDAIDISDEALEVASENVLQHGLEDRVKVFNSNLLEGIDEDEHYHIVVANLPYIGEVTNNQVDKNVEAYEPNSALFAGDDGLELYKKLFQQVVERNMDWRMIVGEFGFGQREDLEQLLNKYFEHKWSIEKDLAG
ncbi:MAG: peptide chain release factor N(5)-glutamine methyltransferase, partial [Candidatus Gracilibacteria bacterium]